MVIGTMMNVETPKLTSNDREDGEAFAPWGFKIEWISYSLQEAVIFGITILGLIPA